MVPDSVISAEQPILLRPVDGENWRDVAALTVYENQKEFVAEPSYYLALCCFGSAGWQPLAIHRGSQVIGFLMWAVDPEDESCWLGGIIIDRQEQGKGYGMSAVRAALSHLADDHGYRRFALSYSPDNEGAKKVYARLGFVETGEVADDELVARLSLPQ